MAVSNATNNSNARDMYEGRSAYQKRFPKKSIEFDTGYENSLFGKVDTLGNAVQINEGYLTFLSTKDDKGNFACINFMADAFNECRLVYEEQVNKKKINLASPFFKNKLTLYSGWKQHEVLLNDHINYVYRLFLDYTFSNYVGITDFDIFLEFFLKFIKEKDLPITRIGFFESIYNPINTSGLVLEIGIGDAGSDSVREKFINDPNYGLVSELLASRGLRFDTQVPWRIIANIQSDNLKKFISPEKPKNKDFYLPIGFKLQDIFDKYYFKSYQNVNFNAFQEFKAAFRSFYNEYKIVFPKKNKLVIKNTSAIKLFNTSTDAYNNPCAIKNTFVFAEEINLEPDSKDEDLFFLDVYYNTRVVESKIEPSSALREFHKQNYRGLYLFETDRQKGIEKALSYINYNIGTLAYRSPSVKEINLTRQGNSSKM